MSNFSLGFAYLSLTVYHLTLLFSCRKRTMFQNIVNATEPMTDEKEAIGYISNNPIRKEIVMYASEYSLKSYSCWVNFNPL